MRKKILLLSALIFALFLALPTNAKAANAQIEDHANLFSDTASLEQTAQAIANQTIAGIFIVTTNGNSQSPEDFTRSYLAQKVGQDNNGVVLLIDIVNRDVYIGATGNMHIYFDSQRINSILDDVQPALSSGNYQQGAVDFLNGVRHYFEEGVPGNRSYTINEQTGEIIFQRSFQPLNILIALAIALIVPIVFVVVTVSKYQLKLGTWKYPYQENSSINLTQKQDTLTNSFVRTRRIPRNNNNNFGGGRGGGGGGFSGGGRKF